MELGALFTLASIHGCIATLTCSSFICPCTASLISDEYWKHQPGIISFAKRRLNVSWEPARRKLEGSTGFHLQGSLFAAVAMLSHARPALLSNNRTAASALYEPKAEQAAFMAYSAV